VLGLSPGQAGPATALVVAGNAVGGLLTALLLHRGARRWLLIGSAFVLMMACATGIFAEAVAVEWKLPLAFLFNFCGGLLPGSVLAAAAAHAPSPGMLGSFNGVVVQSANIGSLIGPPAMALAIGPAGAWSDSHGLILACGGLGLCLALLLGLVERKPPAPS